eukprot:1438085-Ditylum_brightwellii.AAC.1
MDPNLTRREFIPYAFPGPLKRKIHKAQQRLKTGNNVDRLILQLNTQIHQIQTILTQDGAQSDDDS